MVELAIVIIEVKGPSGLTVTVAQEVTRQDSHSAMLDTIQRLAAAAYERAVRELSSYLPPGSGD